MEFNITYVEFWNKIGHDLKFSLSELTYRGHYFLRDRPEIEEILGLEAKGCFLNILSFKVIDEKKFFLAKIKYGI